MLNQTSIDKAFSKFKPESCVFVISVDKKGKPNGMVCGWQMKVSEEPALFAVSLSKKGNTQRLIRQSKEFVVAVPNKGLEKEVKFFGSTHGDKIDKFKESEIATLKAKHVKPPLIKKATINFECGLWKTVDAGECYIFIGKILAAYSDEKKKVLLNMKGPREKRTFKEF